MAKGRKKKAAPTKGKAKRPDKPARKKAEGEIALALGGLGDVLTRLGRPYKLVESPQLLQRIYIMALSQTTVEEASGRLGVQPNTFRDFLSRSPAAKDAWELGAPAGRGALRGRQYTKAMAGGDAMLKWLGINMLGQTNRVNIGGIPGNPVEHRTIADFYADANAT